MGRQTTPPERAGELPARKAKKQHNFFTGLREKNAAEPAPQKPDARAWITRRHGPVRRNGICGGLGSDYLHPSAFDFARQKKKILVYLYKVVQRENVHQKGGPV